jgi:predicted Zn-ribbon and HTH transcriptional regulator
MPTHEEHILRILGEAIEPVFTSEIAELLNLELRPGAAYTAMEVARFLQGRQEQAVQLADGRLMLKRLMR